MPIRQMNTVPRTIWAMRVTRLMWATGEHQQEMAKRLNLGHRTMQRLLSGDKRRANVAFVRRLQRLEAQFAADLEALDAGLIQIRGRRRYCWIKSEPPPERPADLRGIGDTPCRGQSLMTNFVYNPQL